MSDIAGEAGGSWGKGVHFHLDAASVRASRGGSDFCARGESADLEFVFETLEKTPSMRLTNSFTSLDLTMYGGSRRSVVSWVQLISTRFRSASATYGAPSTESCTPT